MMADVLRSRLPETVDQMWDRWMTLICWMDYRHYNKLQNVCDSVAYHILSGGDAWTATLMG